MADNLGYTPGSGANIATDDVAGVHFQKVKLDLGGDGLSIPASGDAPNGLDVDVTRVQGNVTVVDGGGALSVDDNGASLTVDDGGGSLTVDSAQLPGALTVGGNLKVAVQESVAVPVTDNGGSLTTDTPQLPGALVGGRLDVNLGAAPAAITVQDGGGALSVDDNGASLTVDDGGGSLTVDGGVTAAQGAPAVVGNAWPVKVSDGTSTVGITDVSGAKALKVDVVQAVGSSAQTDKGAFVEGTAKFEVIGGVYNETPVGDPAEDQAAAARITAKRAVHVNPRNASGTEIGTAAAPIRVDPTGSTVQPVSDGGGSLTVDMAASTVAGAAVKTADFDTGAGTDTVPMFGVALPKSGGAVPGGTSTDPLRVDPTGTTTQPVSGTVTANQGTPNATPWNQNTAQVGGAAVATAAAGVQKVGAVDEAGAAFSHSNPLPVELVPHSESSQWRASVAFGASQTDIAIYTPAGGKKFAVLGLIIVVTGAGLLKVYDNTNASAKMLFAGTLPAGVFVIQFATPWFSDTANNVLRYSTGAGAGGDITAYGYEV